MCKPSERAQTVRADQTRPPAQPIVDVPRPEPVRFRHRQKLTGSVRHRTCGHFRAPEASFQPWFAHYLISQFGIDRVAREPIININGFPDSELKTKVVSGEVRPDAVVTRHPGIVMRHYANRIGKASDESGLGLLKELAVISELKVGATVQGGLNNKSLRWDVDKLLLLLEEYQATHDIEPPLAYVCVLDNHARRQHSGDEIKDYCESVAGGRIKVLHESAVSRPHLTRTASSPADPAGNSGSVTPEIARGNGHGEVCGPRPASVLSAAASRVRLAGTGTEWGSREAQSLVGLCGDSRSRCHRVLRGPLRRGQGH